MSATHTSSDNKVSEMKMTGSTMVETLNECQDGKTTAPTTDMKTTQEIQSAGDERGAIRKDATTPDIYCPSSEGAEESPKMMKQVLAAIVVGMTHLGIGTIYGFPGVTLPQLTQPDSDDIYLTQQNVALFGSLVSVGAICGGIMTGPITTKLGPKTTLQMLLPITLAFWFLLAFSTNVMLILVARIVLGVMVAAINTTSTGYVLEITHKDRRGLLFAAMPILRQTGFLFLYFLGVSPLSWREMALICGIITTVIPFASFFFFPESPRWLVTKGQEEKSKNSLVFFRGEKYDCQSELTKIIEQVKTSNTKNDSSEFKQLFQKPTLRIFCILSIITILVSFNGAFVLTTYMVLIIQSSSTIISPYTCAILIGLIRVTGTLTYAVVVDRIGRRYIKIYTNIVMSITLALFAGYLHYHDTKWAIDDNLAWLPIATLLIYGFCLGLGQPTLFMINGELMPNHVRGKPEGPWRKGCPIHSDI